MRIAQTDTKESGLESLIIDWLVTQNGYEQGVNETRLFRFLEGTQPEQVDLLGVKQTQSIGFSGFKFFGDVAGTDYFAASETICCVLTK